MNAYELADLLEEDMEEGFGLGFLKDAVNILRQQATLIDYYKVRDDSHQKTIAQLEKEIKELHKIAQVMAMQESNARKSLQNYKDGIK